MKKNNKNLLILAGVAGLCFLGGVANYNVKPVNADELTAGELIVYYDEAGNLYDTNAEGRTAVKLSIEMEYGASVRIVGNNGIRFMTMVVR